MKNIERNNKKIAFIMCANNDMYVEEASFYLNRLVVPDGYEIEQLVVRDANSMTAGYNEAMESSDAKYKIYIHQDVFIIDSLFLFDLLEIFSDQEIGMIGVVGGKKVPPNACFAAEWDTRCTYLCNSNATTLFYDGFDADERYHEVSAVDGMFIATQYDVPWDESYDAWDFYDVSQSIRFKESGYKVVVAQGTNSRSWCLHDEGFCVPRHYDKYRKQFCNQYAKYGFEYDGDSTERTRKIQAYDLDKMQLIESGFKEAGDLTEKERGLNQLGDHLVADTDLSYWRQIADIYIREMDANGKSIFWPTSALDESMDVYRTIKFLLWRMELGCDYSEYSIMFDWIKGRIVSITALAEIVKNTAFDAQKAWEKVLEVVKG